MNTSKAFANRHKFWLRRAILAGVACSIAALTPVTNAIAADEGAVGTLLLDLEPVGIGNKISVVSDDGATWNRIEPSDISLGGKLKITMVHGRIRQFGVFLGECTGHNCFEGIATPLLGSIPRQENYGKEIDRTVELTLPVSDFIVSTTGIAPLPQHGDQIVAACNAALSQGKMINETHSFTFQASVTLGVDSRAWTPLIDATHFGSLGGDLLILTPIPMVDVDFSHTFHVNIPVECKPVPKKAGIKAPFELLSATLHGDPAEYAGACPVGIKLFMSATSNVEGPVEARVEAKSGWKSTKYSLNTTESNADGTWSKHFHNTLTVPLVIPANQSSGGGAMGADDNIGQFGTVPKPEEPIGPAGIPQGPGQFQNDTKQPNFHEGSVRLVVVGGGKTIKTDWWNYKVTCDPKKNPAVGDLPNNVGQAAFVKQAHLTLFPVAPKDGSKCGLTVSGYIQTNVKNVNVKFRLKNHQGNTTNSQTIKTTHANNIGKFVEYIDFSTSGEGVWVSQGGGWALPGAGAGSQAGKKTGTLQIVIETPTKFDGNVASYDFTCYDPAPIGIQTVPTVKVDPDLPKGPSSVVDTGKPHAGDPDNQVELPVPPITCLGGKVKNGRCVCDGKTVVLGGITSGKPTKFRCMANETPTPEVTKPNAIVAVPKISCAGGKVSNGTCVCKPGLKPVSAGKDAFRCIKIAIPTIMTAPPAAPKIVCVGGVVRANRCVCPSGKSLKNGVCSASGKPLAAKGKVRVR